VNGFNRPSEKPEALNNCTAVIKQLPHHDSAFASLAILCLFLANVWHCAHTPWPAHQSISMAKHALPDAAITMQTLHIVHHCVVMF
jgi:hypothetical protein